MAVMIITRSKYNIIYVTDIHSKKGVVKRLKQRAAEENGEHFPPRLRLALYFDENKKKISSI